MAPSVDGMDDQNVETRTTWTWAERGGGGGELPERTVARRRRRVVLISWAGGGEMVTGSVTWTGEIQQVRDIFSPLLSQDHRPTCSPALCNERGRQ